MCEYILCWKYLLKNFKTIEFTVFIKCFIKVVTFHIYM